jgi:hypothetical protein
VPDVERSLCAVWNDYDVFHMTPPETWLCRSFQMLVAYWSFFPPVCPSCIHIYVFRRDRQASSTHQPGFWSDCFLILWELSLYCYWEIMGTGICFCFALMNIIVFNHFLSRKIVSNMLSRRQISEWVTSKTALSTGKYYNGKVKCKKETWQKTKSTVFCYLCIVFLVQK